MDSIVFICFNIGINMLTFEEWIPSNDFSLLAFHIDDS